MAERNAGGQYFTLAQMLRAVTRHVLPTLTLVYAGVDKDDVAVPAALPSLEVAQPKVGTWSRKPSSGKEFG